MQNQIRKIVTKTICSFNVKNFFDYIPLGASCFLIGQIIGNPDSKDILLKLLTAFLFIIGFINININVKKICFVIGIIFYFLLVLSAYGIIQI